MAFDSSKLHTLTESQYNMRLFEVIGTAEGFLATVEDIGDGVATIGYGYNMNAHNNNLEIFQNAGITLTQDQRKDIR
jgi:hypothetical protein